MSLYPLKFAPRFVEKIWGGRKIETVLSKSIPVGKQIGESWEIYDFPPGLIDGETGWASAKVVNGPLAGKSLHELVLEFGESLHGNVPLVGQHGQFPILIKYLDAREDLSVQVHPPQDYADKHPGSYLKTEAWYVMQHDDGARLLVGLKGAVSKDQFKAGILDGTVESLIKPVRAKVGDCHFLPSGTVHALGAGILVAEVQTPSDTTFRVFDFNRLENGKPRKLHVDQAVDCIDFSGTQTPAQKRSHVASFFTTVTRLVDCEFFRIEKVRMTGGLDEEVPYDQPVIWMMMEGEAELSVKDHREPTVVKKGETVLLPAKMNTPRVRTKGDAVWLEVTFPVKG